MKNGSISGFALSLLIAAPGWASGSEGDALALLNAMWTGGGALSAHGGTGLSRGAPGSQADLQRPFPDWDGNHLCGDHWLVFGFTWLDCVGPMPICGAPTLPYLENVLRLATATVTISDVHGRHPVSFPVLTTQMKQVNPVWQQSSDAPEWMVLADDWWYQNHAAVIAPGTLAPGKLRFSVTSDHYFYSAEGPQLWDHLEMSNTFVIDAPGTGVCLAP